MDPDKKFDFVRPPECPVFEPDAEEFSNFEEYIEKIKPLAVQYGLCRIKSPPSWKPPFVADPHKFKFTPRVQRLNEIEANTRVKWMFMSNLDKFWNLQGFKFKNPTIDGKYLDFFKLKKTVDEVGGFETICTKNLWNVVAKKLELSGKKAPSLLKSHYEKYLYPYDIFQAGIHNQCRKSSNGLKHPLAEEDKANEDDIPRKRNKKCQNSRSRNKDYKCQSCERGDDGDVLLLCDGCDEAYHTFCLIPPLSKIPPGDWLCPRCVAKECNQSPATYGFEQADLEYSLDSFTKMADDFKRKYFEMDPKLVPCEVVEKEFWRILSAGDNVVVNYGADNPANVCGSGFPTSSSPDSYQEYVKSSWNLNNLSILPTSTLRYIEEEVSGMKVPWCYVGMVFSCFSWHTEDHYSYSVNYMHWGEPKTWYGVGGADACKLEECMLHHVPELFKYSPDLMHQLTTLLSPSILMSFGVPITRTDQYPGDFIITFPRAYHAGFNQGINFAEAVNYCPADWIKLGRLSVIEYKNVKRACVFSLDELFCKMSLHLNDLQIDLIRILLDDLQTVFNFENKMLERAELSGISKKEKLIFEDLCDDERVCCVCQTTCFLHAVVCNCSGVMSCLEHAADTCVCSNNHKKVLYRFDSQERNGILEKLRKRAERWESWKKQVDELMGNDNKPALSGLEKLLEMHSQAKFPENETSKHLTKVMEECKRVVDEVRKIMPEEISAVVHTRSKKPKLNSELNVRPTLSTLMTLKEELESLTCIPQPEFSYVNSTIQSANNFMSDYNKNFKPNEIGPSSKKALCELIKIGSKINISLEEYDALLKISTQFEWMDDVDNCLENHSELAELKELVEKGGSLVDQTSPQYFVDEFSKLKKLCDECSDLEDRSNQIISLVTGSFIKTQKRRETFTTSVLQDIIEKAKMLKYRSNIIESIEDIYLKVKEWEVSIEQLISRPHKMHLHELHDVIKKVELMPIDPNLIDSLKCMLQHCMDWLDEWNRVICSIKPTSYSLINKLMKLHDYQEKNAGMLTCKADQDIDVSECLVAIKNIRKYNIKMASQQHQMICSVCENPVNSENAESSTSGHIAACIICNSLLHDKCLRDRLTSDTALNGCPSCLPTGSHTDLLTLKKLIDKYKSLKMCLWQGEMLVSLINHIDAWEESVQSFISSDDMIALITSIVPLMKNRKNVDVVMSVVLTSFNQDFSSLSTPALTSFVTTYETLIDLLLSGFITDINTQTACILSCLTYCIQVTYGMKIKNRWKSPGSSLQSSSPISSVSTSPTSSKIFKDKKIKNERKIKKDYIESCSLGSACQLPSSRKVDWVQCDLCDLWYHTICLKLSINEIDVDGVFVCPMCETSSLTVREASSSPSHGPLVAL